MSEHPLIVNVVLTHSPNDGNFYVSAFAANGREIFRSSEGYRNRQDALDAALASWPDAEYGEK